MNDSVFSLNIEDIKCGEENIGQGKNYITFPCSIIADSSKCVAKLLKENEDEKIFLLYMEMLQKLAHPGIIPFVGFCSSSNNNHQKNIFLLKYAENKSLQDVFIARSQGKTPIWWDLEQQYLFIYGIAVTMNYLHSLMKTHQNLTPSNILIDENFEPQITDFYQSKFFPKFELNNENLKKYNLIYYTDPYILNSNGKFHQKSDVFSFAIIAIQILSGNIEIYEDYGDDIDSFIEDLKKGSIMPMIPENIPFELSELLISCLSFETRNRPLFPKICEKLEKIYDSIEELSSQRFKEYKEKINQKNNDEELNPKIKKMKEEAMKGDVEMMYLYAKARFEGQNCKKNVTEAIHFYRMASMKGHEAAQEQLTFLRHDAGPMMPNFNVSTVNVYTPVETEAAIEEENDEDLKQVSETDEESENQYKDNKFISLVNDPSFDEPKWGIDNLLKNVDEQIKIDKKFNFNEEEIKKQNFIFTDGAKERLQKLYNYIKVGVPVLLEGPTGTSKTLSSEIVCKLLNRELIRFNLSSETKTQDLIGRYVGDENSWAGITQKDGPFFRAFKEGKVLLLDEINLASASVLQCIEEALDSGVLSVEIPGRPLQCIRMHNNFRVIATQNPNKGSYANKRQNLGLKFYSRFQVINFPAFTHYELLKIAEGLASRFNYDDYTVINQLVSFHKEWSENPAIADDRQCFTIREIAATVKALSQKEDINDTIMTIYGARYQKHLKKQMIGVLNKYTRLKMGTKKFVLPSFPGCYQNESLRLAVKSTLFSLHNGRNVILTGKEGCGKTQIAMWIADYYNKENDPTNPKPNSFFCVCTEEIKVSDLVGHQSPSGKSDGTSELIKWQDGFLTKAIQEGKCSVLESIDEAPSTVTERLNGLLDQKYDGQEKYFDVPENSANPKVLIKETFRILATSNIDKISQMSPAFLNRFDIIVLENQIDDFISENQFQELITILMDRYCSEINVQSKVQSEEANNQSGDEDDSDSESDFNINVSDDGEEVTKNKDAIKFAHQVIRLYNYSPKIIPVIYQKLKNERNISNISKTCSAIVKLSSVLLNDTNKRITEKDIVDFAFLLLQNNQQFNVPKEIEKTLKDMFQGNQNDADEPFFYEKSPSLCNFLAKLMAYSIISKPVCVTGPTGAGKTSAARAFSRMRPRSSKNKTGFQMHSFHSGTKVAHFFGSTTLLDGQIVFHDGTLTTALKSGLVFIADEFNLSTQSVMKSLSLALDTTIGKNVFIPGTGEIINISPEFHFIACQNEIGTLGRNVIPDSIASRFVYIDYPTPEKEDIENICISIAKENFQDKDFKDDDEELARNIADYMIRLKECKLPYIPQWSLRDITKLFRRIYPQSISKKKFINITPIHHVLFYTLSAISKSDVDNVIEEVKKILQLSFNLSDSEVMKYINCYNATPEIKNIEGLGHYMMKGDSGISINSANKIILDKPLPSLWNARFQVYLADDKEPILLMGNSGFKTFLAKQFLFKSQPITLNQETNVAQLLGTSCFMTNSEAKLFYIKYLCQIVQAEEEEINLRNSWEKGKLEQEMVDRLVNEGKRSSIPVSFHYALNNLSEKLMSDDNTNKNGVLSNTTLEFRPGLFLNAILQGKSLILKNLSNLPTIVLERFNELFSGKQSITLSEDIHNTFTSEDDKELTKFNDSFRVFATCPANSPSKLSEAVLSRFTVISVPEYLENEQEIVLISYVMINELQFDLKIGLQENDISRLNQFATDCSNKLKIPISFPQMIKVVDITSKLNQETSMFDLKMKSGTHHDYAGIQRLNIGITLYRVLGGLLDSKKKKEILFKKIRDYFELPEDYINQKEEECQLIRTMKNGASGVLSKISNLFLQCSSTDECKTKVAFTKSFNDLLDLLHMGLTIHNPIILEGPPGQGKHTAIHYIAEMLNINVVHIMISQSTKFEDLFGKVKITREKNEIHVKMVETQFVKTIKSANSFEKQLIVLDNINYASPALLSALVPVFDANQPIFLPNGSTIDKGKFDIIAIFNTQQTSSSKDKLPSTIINSSIYHIVSKPKQKEILSIILSKFSLAGLSNDEAIKFNNHYNDTRSIISNEGSSGMFTMNDIDKYILFRNLTKNFFHETTISQMIFAYRFSSDEMIQKVLTTLKLENMIFSPSFEYDNSSNSLVIKVSKDENNGLVLPLISQPKNRAILSSIDSLTLPQKHCLTFLGCSVLADRSCVVQGDTASGKSHLIRLFAELMGAKLNVFQMNSDSNISMLAEQSVLKNSISSKDKENFKKAFTKLKVDSNIKKYLEKHIDIKDPKSWNPKKLKDLLKFIKSINNKCSPEIEKAVQLIKETMNPVNRFERQESTFIHALRNGEWVLIDGIESAPSVIAEKISTLCGEKPELNLYEYGPEYYFSKDIDIPENKIHKNFHLFITYNPNSMKESQMIDQTFFIKSVSFTLPPIDERIENSAQMLFGTFKKYSYRNDLSKELAARFALLHDYAKTESKKNPDDFAGDLQYNGRTLKFITTAFPRQNDQNLDSSSLELAKSICFSTKSFYWNSYVNDPNSKNFQSTSLQKFKEKPKDELIISLQAGDIDIQERNQQVLMTLRNIQKHILEKISAFSYSLSNFLELCSLILIRDLPYVQNHIFDTIKQIDMKCRQIDEDKNKPTIKYGSLFALKYLFDPIIKPITPIKNEHKSLSLKDKELKNDESIASELLKLDLLKELLKGNLFSEDSSIILGNSIYSEIISIVSIIATNFKKELFVDLYKQVQIENEAIIFVDKIFPYLLFRDTKYSMISLWIPLSKYLIQKGIHFSYTIESQIIEFNESSKIKFAAHLQMNDVNNFSISTAQLYHEEKFSEIKKHAEKMNRKYDLVYYYLIKDFSENYIELRNKSYVDSEMKKAQKQYKTISNNSINSILSLKDLFVKKDASLISFIWNLIYTLPENEIKELSQIIHPIESDLLIATFNMFNSINQDNIKDIISWSKWASSFENIARILWDIHMNQQNDKSNSDPNVLIENINEVVEYLEKSPERMSEFWSSKKYIDVCQTELTQLKQKIMQDEKDKKALEIQNEIFKLRNSLINQKVNEKYKQMKTELVDKLGNIECTEEKLNFAKNIVEQFLRDATSLPDVNNNSVINFPHVDLQDFDKTIVSENIKFFESLIWYSRIKSILREINNGTDILKNLWKLNDFPEMENPRDNLFTNLIKNAKADSSGLSSKDKDQAAFTLNAHMICKLYHINHSFITDPEKIPKTINEYINRTKHDEREVKWMYLKTLEYSSDFILTIPKFRPNDLVFLITNKKSHSNYQAGPLFYGEKNTVFFKDFKDLMYKEFKSFNKAASSIGKIAYRSLISPEDDIPKDYNSLKEAFIHPKSTSSNLHLITKIGKIFEFAEYLEKFNDKCLLFDDVSFLKNNWIDDEVLHNEYPSLLFWICKNRQCSDQIIKRYHDYEFNENELPLWLLALRIFSSISCVSFDVNSKPTELSVIIKTITSVLVKKHLKDKKGKNLKYNWLNILLSNLPIKFIIPSVSIIHDFFNELVQDNQIGLPPIIHDTKNQSIKESVNLITKKILKNSSKQIITDDITNKDLDCSYFLAFPSKYLQDKVNNSISDGINLILNNENIDMLRKYIQDSNKLSGIIAKLKEAIDEDEKEMKDYHDEIERTENEKRKQSKIIQIKKDVEEYNKIIQIITNAVNDDKSIEIVENKSIKDDKKEETKTKGDKDVETKSKDDKKEETKSKDDKDVETNSKGDEDAETNSKGDEDEETKSKGEKEIETKSKDDKKEETKSKDDKEIETYTKDDKNLTGNIIDKNNDSNKRNFQEKPNKPKKKLSFHDINDNIIKLIRIKANLDVYPELFTDQTISVTYLDYYADTTINVKQNDQTLKLKLPKVNYYGSKRQYLLPGQTYIKSNIKKFESNIKCYEIKFKYIKADFDYNTIRINNKYTSAVPKIYFGQNYNIYSKLFLSNLDELVLKLNLFDNMFYKVLQEREKICFGNFDFIYQLNQQILYIKTNYQAKFSDKSKAKKTENIIQTKLKDYLNYIYPLILKIKYLVDDFYPLWKTVKENAKAKLFKYQYDVQLPTINDRGIYLYNFSKIANLNSLASPIISISPENKIICSVKKLKCPIGPIFSSNISSPYSINIISFINSEVSCKIANLSDNQFNKILSVKNTISNNEPVQIFITPPLASSSEPEIINISGDIIISTGSTKPFPLPFDITLGIVPLTVRLKCLEYKLCKRDRNLRLCCEKIVGGSQINFEVINYYIKQHFAVSVELESMDENEANQPDVRVNKTQNLFSLSIPEVNDPTRCNFVIKVALSHDFVISIICDFIILPLVISFEVYSYIEKDYVRECHLVYMPNVTHQLYFRIMSLYPCELMCKIDTSMPLSVTFSSKDSAFNKSFKIKGNFYLSVDINMKEYKVSPFGQYYNTTLEIGNLKKNIKFKFFQPVFYQFFPSSLSYYDQNKDFIRKFPCADYNYHTQQWEKIKSNEHLKSLVAKPYIVCSPFKYYRNERIFTMVNYNADYVTTTNQQNVSYFQLTLSENIPLLTNIAQFNSNVTNARIPVNDTFYEYNYYSIIGYIQSSKKLWFPAFDIYPDVSQIQFIPYINDNNKKKLAKNNIIKMYLSLGLKEKPKEKTVKNIFLKNNNATPIKKRNFAYFMILLEQKSILTDISGFIKMFPPNIQANFVDFINFAENINKFLTKNKINIEDILDIIAHNLILKFTQVFKAQYDQLKSDDFCLDCPISNIEMRKVMDKMKEYLFKYDKSKDKERSKSTKYEFNEKEKILSKISIEPLPEDSKRSDCYIISENESPKPCKNRDPFGIFDFDANVIEETENSDNIDSIASLPPIEIPTKYSIDSLNTFYSLCSQGATALPSYIRLRQIQSKDQKESELYFSKLLSLYKDITMNSTKNHSILANHINSFIESFQNCVRRLKKAGIDFSKTYLPQSLNDEQNNFQDFIKCPSIDYPILRKTEWKLKSKNTNNYMKFVDPLLNKGKFGLKDHVMDDMDEDMLNYLNEDTTKENEEKDKITVANTEINLEDKKLLMAQIIGDKNPDEDDNEEKDILDEDEDQLQQNKPTLRLAENSKMETVSSKDISGIFPEFPEQDSILRILQRIREMKKNGKNKKLKFLNSTECIIQNQNELFKSAATVLPVQNLVFHSQNLIANLIGKASDTKCPFLEMSCNLLIDCSSFICNENKLYNFMIVIAFSYALSALEIPFSIAIVADQKFRFVLKPFEEEISMLVLQRILDCLFIERFKTNIADTFYHALEYMKCPDPKRTQRALFFFSNGLDENLILTESWKESLLNKSNNSFGMIFVKSKFLDDKTFPEIQDMWDSFNNEVSTAPSITRLTYINPDLNTKTLDLIISIFCTVLSRPQNRTNDDIKNRVDKKPEFILSYEDLSKESFQNIQNGFNFNFDEGSSSIFRKIDQRFLAFGSRFPKLDIGHYRNKTEKITNSSPCNQIREEFDQFLHRTILLKRNSFRPLLETIFKPNKASQTVLSSTGTDFDITALILNLINPVPDPLIYLEDKGGLIRNYGISIIIDSSKSCFNSLSASHSYQSIKILFAALSSIDVPCVDVIIATDESPIVLASEIPSLRLFSDKSSFWPSLFKCLSESSFGSCSLESAIHAAYDIRRMRSVDSTSYMFVLTDGLFQQEQRELIQNHIMTCIQSGITVFGVGIGIYPSGIIDLFPQVIFATNPNDLIKGIASCFGDDTNDSYDNMIKQLAPEPSSPESVGHTFEILLRNENNVIFKDLKNYLSETTHAMDAFSDMYNEEQEEKGANNELVNPKGLNTEMYVKGILEGQKILIVMLYDCIINIQESSLINPDFLLSAKYSGEKCVKNAVEFFGIDIVVVQNYKEAVLELTKQTNPGKCDYYATWVLSGYPYDTELPHKGNPHLVDQFIDCLIQFWNKGGSVVLFAESDPLTFQANKFLEKVTFPDGSKTKLRLGGNHKGMKYLKGDPTGSLSHPGTFNRSPLQFQKCHRASLSHNIYTIYEGETISFAPSEKSLYKPFTPFMKDSENGISALFYPGDQWQKAGLKNIPGDIIVDCGYTKLFDKISDTNECDTFRYVQNIAGWTAQCEFRRSILKIKPKDFRPEAVIFKLNENAKSNLQKPPKGSLQQDDSCYIDFSNCKRLFAIDYSGSVEGCSFYHRNLRKIFKDLYKSGDTIMTWSSNAYVIDYNKMMRIIDREDGTNGTRPSSILEVLERNESIPREHLILVTDGHIDGGDIDNCDKIVQRKKIKFKYVTTYIIGPNGDLSVGAPFARECGSVTYEVLESGTRTIEGAKCHDFSELENIDSIRNIKEFNAKYIALRNATKQKMIGREKDMDLLGKYERLRERLQKSVQMDPETIRRLNVLIRLSSGELRNIFNDKDITVLLNK